MITIHKNKKMMTQPSLIPIFLIITFLIMISACLETKKSVMFSIQSQKLDQQNLIDLDGDGFSELDGDCHDQDAKIHPMAMEIFGDQIDQNCRPEPCEPHCPKLELILISSGQFYMEGRSNSDQSIRWVEVKKNFYLSKSEITIAQYQACVDQGVCTEPDHQSSRSYCNWGDSSRLQHPVNCVDWQQARVFSQWMGGDLPSEAQWEYAARSEGKDIIYPWGNMSPSCELANYQFDNVFPNIDCIGHTSEVCTLLSGNTRQGVCDMAGNVMELVLDEYHENNNNHSLDESPWCSLPNCDSMPENGIRIVKGGGWASSALALEVSQRKQCDEQSSTAGIGFRIVFSF
jgi:formylglycine-generating enzyme required for sulfatase activity